MPSALQMEKLLTTRGFTAVPDEGFVRLERRHPEDGRRQWVRIFCWSNAKHADRPPAVPRAYLVVLPCLDQDRGDTDHGRYRIPLVHWPDDPAQRLPARQQARRTWGEVAAEFHEVITSALDAPHDRGEAALDALGERYRLP